MTEENYKPSKKEKVLIGRIYKDVTSMIDARNEKYNEFNNRTLVEFMDDSEKRLNAYVPSKASQGKDDWQSNVALPTIRNSQKRMLAGFALVVPDLGVKAFGLDNQMEIDKAEVTKNLVRGSYLENENPVLENFWEAWACSSVGTIIVYEGFLKTKHDQKYIESYDPVTGDVKFKKREVTVDNQCISLDIPLTELFIHSFYVHDIQNQPRIAWIRYYEEDVFEYEFGHYSNAKFVKTFSQYTESNTTSFFNDHQWRNNNRAGKNKIEVVRYYNKLEDEYIIVANGVLLFEGPLLWTSNGVKVYPFAKSIWEPFANKKFFYGNAMPNIMMGEYDTANSLWNSVMDKEFRSIVKPLLIGAENRDAFELEDENVAADTKIYVQDITQVKPIPIDGVSASDIQMIQLVARGLEQDAPTSSALLSKGANPTAREVVATEEKMRELKSTHQTFLSDLWRQKFYLRLANIQLHYPIPSKIMNDKGKIETIYKTYLIEDVILNEQTSERGVLGVQFRNISDKNRAKVEREISVEEEMMKQQGVAFRKIVVGTGFLDGSRFKMEVIPESMYKINLAKMQTAILEKLQTISTFFPQIFIANQDEYFSQTSVAYEDDPDPYIANVNKMIEGEQGGVQGQEGALEGVQPQVPQLT